MERCGLGCVPFLEGKNQLTHHPKVQAVLESPKLKRFFERHLFGGQDALTFDFKWLRVMPNDKFTGIRHICYVQYMCVSPNVPTFVILPTMAERRMKY